MAQIMCEIGLGSSNLSIPQPRRHALGCQAYSNRFGSQRFHEARSRGDRTPNSSTNRGPRIRWGPCAPKAARPWNDSFSLEDIERMASAAVRACTSYVITWLETFTCTSSCDMVHLVFIHSP